MTGVRTRRVSRGEYERLVEIGFFQPGERVESVGGLLVAQEPQGSRHATGIRKAEETLRRGPVLIVEVADSSGLAFARGDKASLYVRRALPARPRGLRHAAGGAGRSHPRRRPAGLGGSFRAPVGRQ